VVRDQEGAKLSEQIWSVPTDGGEERLETANQSILKRFFVQNRAARRNSWDELHVYKPKLAIQKVD